MQDKLLAAQCVARHRPNDAQPHDKIFVKNLVLPCEIGVFHNEKGVTQRVRFNVYMDIRPPMADLKDDIDHVISYDMIVDGIKSIISTGHINLVETLAEQIAAHCLQDRRAVEVLVRVEKLDKEPEAVGVEIVRRTSAPEAANIYELPSKTD